MCKDSYGGKGEFFQEGIPDNYVVGIGASAGGLEALQSLLTALPSNTGFSYIVIQHLSPDYKSLLSEILSKYTKMPVYQVEDGMAIKPNCVYVIQPGKNMRISKGKLLLSSQKEHELNLPIDLFFRSLAEYAGSRAIAIILSGTGSDGANGIKAIKENDGLILVQDPETANFDGMPKSALRTGIVDAQITTEQMALELAHISNSVSSDTVSLKTERQVDEELMKKIYIILKKISNINFTHYKQTTILRRIERRMMLTHKESLTEYVDFLYESPDEVRVLSKEVLIGVTNFFRDPEFFQNLKESAIQDIVLNSTEDLPIRVWVAGCSTGEEAYSIAILFCEVLDNLKLKRHIKIFATDLDMASITVAGKGIYSDSIIESVSPARLSRYFTRQNNSYIVNRDIRKMIVFSPHNVFQDPPFGKLDLISCRNMLIYFQPVLQNDLFAIFHSALKNNGYLFLGKSEAIGNFTEAFPIVNAAAKIFAHRSDVKISGAKTVPYLQTTFLDDEVLVDANQRYSRSNSSEEISRREEKSIDNSLLEQFMPACLVVNEKNEIVHCYGESKNFVHFSLGKFSNVIFDVITEALKVPVSTILKEARDTRQKVQYKNICFVGEIEQAEIILTAMPVTKSVAESDNLYAVVFSKVNGQGEMANAVPYDIDRIASQRITDLEQDLGNVQDKLDRSIAEQECVNEELQAANEELLTANEELQSSNEELQSVNEELYTVNTEYQQKLTELADLNDDIANFLSSTLIGIIFVDNKLNIRRYTDYVTTEFSVMDHDIGRSLKFISYHFPSVDITDICDNVLKTLVPDEREVSTSKNKVFFLRVAPYRSTENKILGCVITFVDVTTQKQGLVKLQNTEEKLSVLQQKNEAQVDYLSRITHEIRTPMVMILGLAKSVTKKIDDKNALLDNLKKITDTVEYMASIVTDISAASQSNSPESVEEKFKLCDVLSSVDTIERQSVENAGVTFEISVNDNIDTVFCDNKTSVEQILINFINNSIKYTPKGGAVSLKVAEVSTNDNSSEIRFIISDTGIGIEKDFIPEIFKPFTRQDSAKATDSSGMGLGLSIAHNLIKSMNGSVDVQSKPGIGSTFTITINLRKYHSEGESSNPVVEHRKLSGCHVLIAEDNAVNRMILGEILNNEGISFVEASNGEEAFSLFKSEESGTFDCILMDIRMPKIDGYKATKLIRDCEKPDAKTIPIIGLSASCTVSDIEKAKKAGINSYLTKPIDRDDLIRVMENQTSPKA